MVDAKLEKIILEVPAMYADHHVTEVRRILFSLPGMQEVYASSAFKVVEATYDPAQLSADAVRQALDAAGYLGDLSFPVESGEAVGPKGSDQAEPAFFRHTATYEAGQKGISFGQNVNYLGRPLWPCPGMGVIKNMEE
ncbi:MAG TPA: heavy-metal-associated domain-containing protein [Anaerolineales bacterium]